MTSRPSVAIVGMGVTFPGAPDLATYWHNLRTGVDAITPVPEGRHDPAFHADGPDGPERSYCHRGGFVPEQVAIDLAAAGIMPGSVDGMDPDQLLALAVASAAVADAGGMERLGAPGRIGVVLGRGGYLTSAMVRFEHRVRTIPALLRTVRAVLPDVDDATLATMREQLLAGLGPHSPEATIGLVPNLSASRIANRLDLRGPAYTVDAACASSLVAVDQAMTDLATGRCDTVLAGGVHHCHDETLWSTFTQLGALSRTGRSAPFAADADGLLIGEGTGVVVLKRLDDARRAGDRIYAVITGSGVSGDGKGRSLFAPDSGGQTQAVRAAWREAGVDPAAPGSIGLLEAHGTATRAGDDAELTTLATVFGGPSGDDAPVIGSVKSMIGHTMPAAGIAALVKAALAVHHGVLLPTLHCAVEPSPLLGRTRFRVLDRAEEWTGDGPRRAGVDAFGFGGINAHVVLEGEPARAPAVVVEPERVLRLAARTPAELAELLDRLDVVAAAGEPVGTGPCRLGIVGPTERSLRTARAVVARAAQQGITSWRGRGDVWFTTEPLLPAGRVTYVFPGLEAAFAPAVADVAAHLGRPEPAPTTVGDDLFAHADGVMAVGRLLADATERLGVPADAMLGHSVGEWAAMAAAGMFGAEGSGTDPAVLRRRFWPAGLAVPDVVFAALGCSRAEAAARAADEPGLVVSHDNAPRQSIVCGPPAPIARLLRRCRDEGVIARELPFRSGFHTPAFAPMTGPFRELVEALPMLPGRVPVMSCTTVTPFPADADAVRRIYLRHLVEPVRFREAVTQLWDEGHRVFVVMGTGGVGSFVTDTLGDLDHLVVAAGSDRRTGLDQLRRVAAACWVEGAEPDLAALDDRPDAGARPPAPRGSVAVRLGVTPLTLDPAVLPPIAAALRPAAALPAVPAGLSPVVAAALRGLHEDTVAATHAVLAAVGAARAPAAPPPAAAWAAGPDRSRVTPLPSDGSRVTPLHSRPGPAPGPAPASPAPPATPAPAAARPDERTVVVPVSLDALPELAGHRFHRQRDGWPDEADRRPVVPATAIIDLAVEHATAAWPGTAVTGVRDARFLRWLTAAPAREVEMVLRRVSPERIDVTVGDFARLTLRTGPAAPLPPRRRVPPSPVPPPHDAAAVYDRRLMFHGPAYQGITAVRAVGAHHVYGEITVPSGRGGLLDNVGQLLGVWLLARHDDGLVALPRRIEAIDWAGALPGPGERVDCLVLASTPAPDALVMDAELVHDGRVVATIRGWDDVRMPFDRTAQRFQGFPDQASLAQAAGGGVFVARDTWPGSATCDFLAGFVLNTAERERYERLTPRGRRQWLLGRIAVKDAVRELLGEQLYPAEVWITNDDRGRPLVRGRHRDLPAAEVSIAHRGAVGVALAGPAGSRPGVDVEPVTDPPASTVAAALGPAERGRWDGLGGGGAWFARFWTAKEAAAKARGTGLEGHPRAFEVQAADEHSALVRDPDGAEHRVRFETIDVAGQPYVVARTGGPGEPAARES